MIALLRSPGAGAVAVLERGRPLVALGGIVVATALAALAAARFANDVRVQDVVFGPRRSPLVGRLIEALGVDLAATVVYTLERAFGALVLAGALTPALIWVLGATAVHAAARLRGSRARFGPYFVFFGYATALARVPAEGAAALLGGVGAGAQVAQIIGLAALLWLGGVAWRGIVLHYGVPGERALAILVLALVLFYVVPLAFIVVAIGAVVVAAGWLGIFSRP